MAISRIRIFALAFLAGGSASVWVYHTLTNDSELLLRIQGLEQEQIRLERNISFLKERKRVARIEVLEQIDDPEAHGNKRTKIKFFEVGKGDAAFDESREFTVEGDLLYVDAQIIKFDPDFLQQNELEQGSTLLLFRRLFGEYQAPHDGFLLDNGSSAPPRFSAEDGMAAQGEADLHGELWRNFWHYANRPEVVRRSGIRAMHGEAPYVKLVPDGKYEVELRTTDGLSIRAMD